MIGTWLHRIGLRRIGGLTVHALTVHALAVLLLAACAQMPPPVSPEEAARPLIAPGREIVLPRLADLGRSVEATQLITVQREGQSFTFEGRISITPERLLLVGVDATGRRALTLTWTAAGVSVEAAAWLPPALRPGPMLADLVLLYWPDAVVRAALPRGGSLTAAAHSREISLDGRPVLRAAYGFDRAGPWTGALHYANFSWGYEIDVQSQELVP